MRTESAYLPFILLLLGMAMTALPRTARADGRLEFEVFPSPVGIDWQSPSTLAWSTVRNELSWSPHSRRHSIGHVNIRVTCDSPQQGRREFLTGMTSNGSSAEFQALFGDRIGLGILFHTLPGRLESAEEIEAQLPARYRRGDISRLAYQISDSTCDRLLTFHEQYEASGDGARYGLPLRPRYHEGGGCSAYGVAYLDLAGLLDAEMHERWSKTIRVPVDLIGGGEAETPMKRVSFFRILLSPWRRWAKESEPHRSVHFWDPDAMHQWIQEVFKSERTDYQRVSLDNAIGLERDARQVPTPTDPIFLK